MRILQMFLLTLLLATAATAGPIVGVYSGGNCYPFSCGPTGGLTQYLEVYANSAFSGPLTINAVSFFAFPDNVGTDMDSATYDVSFAVTPASAALLPGLGNNAYSNLAAFGSFTLGGQMPGVLTLTGTSSYSYNPADGDLMMVVDIRNVTSVWGQYMSYFQADYTGSGAVRRTWTGAGDPSDTSGALVTEFNGDTQVTPEPASFALASLGLLGAWFARRRRC